MKIYLTILFIVISVPAYADWNTDADDEHAYYHCLQHEQFDFNVAPKNWKYQKGFEICEKIMPTLEKHMNSRNSLIHDEEEKKFWETAKRVLGEKKIKPGNISAFPFYGAPSMCMGYTSRITCEYALGYIYPPLYTEGMTKEENIKNVNDDSKKYQLPIAR